MISFCVDGFGGRGASLAAYSVVIGFNWVLFWLMGVIGCRIGPMIRADSIQITPEILGLITKIDEFKGAWRALGTLAPDRL